MVNGGESGRAENEAESAAAAPPRRTSRRLRLAVIALALAALAAIIGAYMLGRGERDEIATNFEDLPKISTEFDGMDAIPWEGE